MKLSVTVKPGSKITGIEILSETKWVIKVREPATEGKANSANLEAIANKLDIPKTRVVLLKGSKSKHKLVEIL